MNDHLYVTAQGGLILPNSQLAKPGDRVPARLFSGQQIEDLVAAGTLSREPVKANGQTIDVRRDPGLPALPLEMTEKTAPRARAGADEAAIERKAAEVRAKANAETQRAAEERERQEKLAAVVDEELTPEEAKALGLIS